MKGGDPVGGRNVRENIGLGQEKNCRPKRAAFWDAGRWRGGVGGAAWEGATVRGGGGGWLSEERGRLWGGKALVRNGLGMSFCCSVLLRNNGTRGWESRGPPDAWARAPEVLEGFAPVEGRGLGQDGVRDLPEAPRDRGSHPFGAPGGRGPGGGFYTHIPVRGRGEVSLTITLTIQQAPSLTQGQTLTLTRRESQN